VIQNRVDDRERENRKRDNTNNDNTERVYNRVREKNRKKIIERG
jgi:hypothetical protein